MDKVDKAAGQDTETTADVKSNAMIRTREGTVLKIVGQNDGRTESLVSIDGEEQLAISYDQLTGGVFPGDRVALNTTAVSLSLGTGGAHFVMAVRNRVQEISGPGHTMKVRYTPSQVCVLSAEDEKSPYRHQLEDIPDLAGLPVIVGSVHSQLPIIAAAVRSVNDGARIVYVMTDGGALPVSFSKIVGSLKRNGLVDYVITAGHAFGGDLETVTVHSALAAAYNALQADIVIVVMGPGVVGTGTPLGTTALEQGPVLDAVCALGGFAVPVLRISFADERERHHGLSHHSFTVLTRFVHYPLDIALPFTDDPFHREVLLRQIEPLKKSGHRVHMINSHPIYAKAKQLLDGFDLNVTTMGRSDVDDPVYFHAVAAAARIAIDRMESPHEQR